MTTYYNEHDAYCCAWLKNLMDAGHIEAGRIDGRDIQEVAASDLTGVTRGHFFAGIAGWELALRLAGWPADWPVWTGSCPCQPFSVAGKKKGTADERHLWPEFRRLIAECRPSTIFGEQVASKDGRLWLDGVRADLEALGYVVGAADLCAAGVNAPHIRQRLFWVAYTRCRGLERGRKPAGTHEKREAENTGGQRSADYSDARGLALSEHPEWREVCVHREDEHNGPNYGRAETHRQPGARGEVRVTSGGMADATGARRNWEIGGAEGKARNETRMLVSCADRGLGDPTPNGRDQERPEPGRSIVGGSAEGRVQRPWDDFDAVPCRDGKARRVEPGTFPLAHGVPGRVGKLRAYGNAIVPQVTAEFVMAFMDTLRDAPSAEKTKP